MHAGTAGLRQVNNTDILTTKNLGNSSPVTTSTRRHQASRLPLAVFIWSQAVSGRRGRIVVAEQIILPVSLLHAEMAGPLAVNT
jgi:hypothetical protein